MKPILDLRHLDLRDLMQLQSIDADLELARRVVCNDEESVAFFLGSFSRPLVEYIASAILNYEAVVMDGVVCYYPQLMSEYYEFIAARLDGPQPEWRKVGLYSAQNNARLYSYINTISVRHFMKVKARDDKKKNVVRLTEKGDLETLRKYNGFDASSLFYQESDEMRWAWSQLPERDKMVLTYTIVEERDTDEVFELLKPHVDWKTAPELLGPKKRQDAVALLKGRAKKHLRLLILSYRNKQRKI